MVYAGHQRLAGFEDQLQEAVVVPFCGRGIEDQELIDAVGDELQPRDRIGQVVEDALEQADIEAFAADLGPHVEQVTQFESDLFVRPAEVFLEEPGLVDPVCPHIEPEGVRAEFARQEAVSATIARAIDEAFPAQTGRIEQLEQRSKLRRVDRADCPFRRHLVIAVDRAHVGGQGDVRVPR
jgi:hypothetical protein